MYEPSYCVGDMYATVESEAFDRAGEPVVLIRLVHPPTLVHAHLTSLRPMPSTTYTLSELLKGLHTIKTKYPYVSTVHLVGDMPELNNFEPLILGLRDASWYVTLNSYGTIPINTELLDNISSLYVILKPGLLPTTTALRRAREVRGYIKEEGDEFWEQLEWVRTHSFFLSNKLFAMPFTLDPECIEMTIRYCLNTGVRAQIPLCRVINLDENFMGPEGMKVVNTFHLQDRALTTNTADPYPRLIEVSKKLGRIDDEGNP